MKKWLTKVKKKMEERLEHLAEENRKMYHGERLDCCTINKNPVVKGKAH